MVTSQKSAAVADILCLFFERNESGRGDGVRSSKMDVAKGAFGLVFWEDVGPLEVTAANAYK